MAATSSSTKKSTQDFVPIQEIRDGVIVLKDNTILYVLMASSTNFALKSVDEQEAILMQYRNFLNSLDFSVQFFVESRKLDIEPYLESLRETLKEQTNELLAIQTKEYIEFVKSLVASTNIVSKFFYVVVPYKPATLTMGGSSSPFSKITSMFGGGESKSAAVEASDNFAKNKLQLEQRVAVVQAGLSSSGIKTVAIGTEEAIELFYKLFNPVKIDKGVLTSFT